MNTSSVFARGTSTDDLIRWQTASTSTSHFVTSSDAAIQTEDQEFLECCSADSESEISGEELGARAVARDEAEERTWRKRLMLSEEENDNDEDETGASRRVLSTEEGGRTCVRVEDRNRETPVHEISLPSPVDKVEIIQDQRTIHNNYIVQNIRFDWDDFNEHIISRRIAPEQRKMEQQLQSVKRKLKNEKKKIKAIQRHMSQTQLLQHHASDTLREQLRAEMAQLREEFERKQQELEEAQRQIHDQQAQLAVRQDAARREEEEVRSFVFRLGGKYPRVLERVWTELKEPQFVHLMTLLYQQFTIKLQQVGINCGIRFQIDIPPEHAEVLAEQEATIQETIVVEIVPKDFQAEVAWESTVPVLGEAELGPPVQVSHIQDETSADIVSTNDSTPVQVTERQDETSADIVSTNESTPVQVTERQEETSVERFSTSSQQAVPRSGSTQTFDPMTATPHLIFEVNVTDRPYAISSLVVTRNGLVVLANITTKQIMHTPLYTPDAPFVSTPDAAFVSTLIEVQPWDMNVYERDVIAVTSNTHDILMVKVRRDAIYIDKKVTTRRRYGRVTSFGHGDVLVVGTMKDKLGPAAVDVITREGKLLWTVTDTLPNLRWPFCLRMRQREVLIADRHGLIHRLDVIERKSYPTLSRPDLRDGDQMSRPDLRDGDQMTVDADGYVYVTSRRSNSLLVHSVSSNQWRVLLKESGTAYWDCRILSAVGVTENAMMAVFWEGGGPSVLRVYLLSS